MQRVAGMSSEKVQFTITVRIKRADGLGPVLPELAFDVTLRNRWYILFYSVLYDDDLRNAP